MAQKVSKKDFTAYLVVTVILAVVGVKYYIDSSRGDVKKDVLARFKGNPSAPLHIVEFIDFQCPACAHGAKRLKQVMELHPNIIYLQMKYFPLAMHRHALLSARYAHCAAEQGAFWPFHDLLVQRQGQWLGLIDAGPAFVLMVDELKLNRQKFESCLVDEKTQMAIEKDKAEGTELGVKSTPTYFINGKMVVGTKSLEDELRPYLEGKKN